MVYFIYFKSIPKEVEDILRNALKEGKINSGRDCFAETFNKISGGIPVLLIEEEYKPVFYYNNGLFYNPTFESIEATINSPNVYIKDAWGNTPTKASFWKTYNYANAHYNVRRKACSYDTDAAEMTASKLGVEWDKIHRDLIKNDLLFSIYDNY